MITVMITLFVVVVVGYVAGRLGYLGGDFDRQLSRLVINITCPALILSSSMTGELPDRRFILPLLLISVITYVVLAAVAFLLPRYLTKCRADEGAIGFALMFGNVGFMGYPVVASIFGHEAIFYAAVLNVVNTFAVFTVGTMLITGAGVRWYGGTGVRGYGGTEVREYGSTGVRSYVGTEVREYERERFQKKVLYSTPMLAAYLTMLIVAFEIKDIPAFISQPLTMIGNITVPAALLIVGSSMSQLPLRALMGNLTVYLTTALRLVLLPLGVYLMTRNLGFSELVVSINTVVIAMPVATYGTILCLKYEKDTTFITEATFITTLCSMVTIPLLVMLLSSCQ